MLTLPPTNPLFLVLPVLLAWATAALLVRLAGDPGPARRYAALDGLRGVLSLGVFFGHGVVWYYFTRNQLWDAPSSIYGYLAQYGVVMFFMLTGFLFTIKLLGARKRGVRVDWLELYTSRITRLFPIYLFAVALVIIIALALSSFALRDPIWRLTISIARWLGFSISGAPNINQVKETWIIIAGVTWSLAYEWLFYAALPLGALLFGLKPSIRSVIISATACLLILFAIPLLKPIYFIVFLLGALASAFTQSRRACEVLSGTLGSLLAIISIVGAVVIFPGGLSPASIVLASVCFTIIACGNTLFGILTWPSIRMLGDISYSMYLMHGILLFCAFRGIAKYTNVAQFTVVQHWLFVSLLTVALVGLSYLTFRLIEWPVMRATPRIQARIRAAIL